MARDYIHTAEKDLLIKNGDFVVGFADEQLIENVLLAHQGEVKEFPLIGVGIDRELNAPVNYRNNRSLHRRIQLQLTYDGAKDIRVIKEIDDLKIDAKY